MKKHLVVTEDNFSNIVDGEYELKSYLSLLEGYDTEYYIYEQDRSGVWVEAEFYCNHEYYAANHHGGWVERCENMGKDPYGCFEHRSDVI